MVPLRAIGPIVDAFVARLDEVVERCSTAIWETVPSYGRAGEAFRKDLREAIGGNVTTLSQVLCEGRDIRREEMESIERVGARRAEAGIPLDDVLHAYRTVSRVCWDVLAEECRNFQGDALEAAIELARSVLRYTDEISTGVVDAYSRAQRAIVREQEGARREFLADVLYRTDSPPEDVLRRAHTFGYDLSLGYLAVVGSCPGDPSREAAFASAAAATNAHGTADPIVLQKGDQTIALLPVDPFEDAAVAPEKLLAELSGPWRFGVGGPEPGLEGIRRAYLEAREALEIGTALGQPGPIYRFEDLLLYHFLRAEPALVARFVDQMLAPLVEYDGRRKGELVKTLEAYLDCDGSVKRAGEHLFAHPHTVTYRLKQMERLSGWSLRDAEAKLKLQLALRARRLAPERPEE
ncbi:MAG: PucR family transcriptional regulator [Actinomycetota bacterium]